MKIDLEIQKEVFESILQELKGSRLKPNQIELLRVLFDISKGESKFEASNKEIGKIVYGDIQSATDNARNSLITLKNWQDATKITLLKIIDKGGRYNEKDGKLAYKKTEYDFKLLTEIEKSYKKHPENKEKIIESTLKELKKNYKKEVQLKLTIPEKRRDRAKNTIFTKFDKTFEFADKSGDDPVEYCQQMLDTLSEKLIYLKNERNYKINREKFIEEFEKKIAPVLSKLSKNKNTEIVI